MRSALGSILVICVLAGGEAFSIAQCNTCPERRQISVNGTGTVTADADLAIVRVGYKLYGAVGHVVSVGENQGQSFYSGPIAGAIGGMGMGTGIADRLQFGNEQLAINSRRVEFSVTVFAVFAIE
jgi:hypothetical protein